MFWGVLPSASWYPRVWPPPRGRADHHEGFVQRPANRYESRKSGLISRCCPPPHSRVLGSLCRIRSGTRGCSGTCVSTSECKTLPFFFFTSRILSCLSLVFHWLFLTSHLFPLHLSLSSTAVPLPFDAVSSSLTAHSNTFVTTIHPVIISLRLRRYAAHAQLLGEHRLRLGVANAYMKVVPPSRNFL